MPFSFEERKAALANPIRSLAETWVLGLEGGEPVAAGYLELRMLDNPTYATVDVLVAPEVRRRGHGTRMLQHIEDRAIRAGRSVFNVDLEYPYDAGDDWGDKAFARAHGYRQVHEEIQRILPMPVAPEYLAQLAAQAEHAHGHYRIETYLDGEQPEDVGRAVAALDATLIVEAPTGDRDDLEAEAVDEEADREAEVRRRAQRRTRVRSVALTADGEAVAYSDLAVPEFDPGKAFQWGTLVRRDHRGHKLGLATKVASLSTVQRLFPDVRRAVTWNAASNSHMIAINEALGYRASEKLATWEKRFENSVPITRG